MQFYKERIKNLVYFILFVLQITFASIIALELVHQKEYTLSVIFICLYGGFLYFYTKQSESLLSSYYVFLGTIFLCLFILGYLDHEKFLLTLKSEKTVTMSVGIKDDNGKSRLDLIAPGALLEMGQVLAHGAEKYSEDNWKKVENGQDRYYAAAMRHLLAWRQGEKLDPESGLTHLAHAMTNLMFLHALDASPVAVLGRPDESKPTEAEYVQLTWTNRDRRWKPE